LITFATYEFGTFNLFNLGWDELILHAVLQNMLAEPDMQHIANSDAAAALESYPSLYQQLVHRCVAASQALHSRLFTFRLFYCSWSEL